MADNVLSWKYGVKYVLIPGVLADFWPHNVFSFCDLFMQYKPLIILCATYRICFLPLLHEQELQKVDIRI